MAADASRQVLVPRDDRARITHQFLAGITFMDWWRLVGNNRIGMHPRYWQRAAFLTLMSLVNTWYRAHEERTYADAIAATPVATAPIFVLGHWRSGTTYLHNLLVGTTTRFAYPTVYQASFPHTFLSTEQSIPRWAERYVPRTRGVDRVTFDLSRPQEDEFALCIASGCSALLSMVFPERTTYYDRYLTLRGIPPSEREHWKANLLWFVKKLTYAYNKPLVLKSPPHTARIRWLLELFPDARFIHIRRDPYAVFQSTRHMYDTLVWRTYLQTPDDAGITDGILDRYVAMYDAYFEDCALIPAGQFHEVSFEELRRDPLGQLRDVYNALDLAPFAEVEPRARAYLSAGDAYEQNSYATLPAHDRARVTQAWHRNFERWGYAT